MQIEGIGIVEGTTNETLSKLYVDYALSPDVQDLLATNNWMFPASSGVDLPPCYDYAITTENVTALNTLVTPDYIGANYQAWLTEWQRIILYKENWWIWVVISSAIVVAVIITVTFYVRNTKLRIKE